MKTAMITTNLRLHKDNLIQYKSLAADLDMSFNQFVSEVLEIIARKPELVRQLSQKKAVHKKDMQIWDLPKMAVPFKKSEEADWSEEDKIIYDI